jgi:hypothetical protein
MLGEMVRIEVNSVLQPSEYHYGVYQRDLFVRTPNDWGYYGSGDRTARHPGAGI